tara:strand:+ start:1637 stop:2884 length:1248 start_codon:yes stop_codon:yes gene_type:complete
MTQHQDTAAEEAVLASAFVSAPSALEVLPSDFTDARRAAMWAGALALEAAGRPVDVVTLEGWLTEHYPGLVELEQIGAAGDRLGSMVLANISDYSQRLISRARRRDLHIALRDACSDPESDPDVLAAKVLAKLETLTRARGASLGVSAKEGIQGAIKALQGRKGESYGLPTGFPTLDKTIGGLGPGEVSVLSGITGTGKTALALQIADFLADHKTRNAPVLYFSGEMLADDLWLRILCRRARCSLAEMRTGVTHDELQAMLQAAKAAMGSTLQVADNGMSLPSIRAKIHRFAMEHPGGLVVIDHLDHVECKAESAVQSVATIMRRIKAAALACKIPVLLVAQFNRGFDGDRKPTIFDLKGGSAIEQYADNIWLLHAPDKSLPRWVQLSIDKNRRGPHDQCNLEFERRYTDFKERK